MKSQELVLWLYPVKSRFSLNVIFCFTTFNSIRSFSEISPQFLLFNAPANCQQLSTYRSTGGHGTLAILCLTTEDDGVNFRTLTVSRLAPILNRCLCCHILQACRCHLQRWLHLLWKMGDRDSLQLTRFESWCSTPPLLKQCPHHLLSHLQLPL